MSEQEIYEIAQRRIDQRNRRWTIWGIDLAGLILVLAALIFLGETAYVTTAAAIFMAWAGIFTLHTIVVAMAQSREKDIHAEVDKLRDVISDYEKPKRLELGDDGELVERDEQDDWQIEEAQSKRLS
ncbi:MAG: hypothetical protein GC179_29965 [Anaerolineaceae bacterium]|nr:hypothetical protein [Anaerolineaceae bacterium]